MLETLTIPKTCDSQIAVVQQVFATMAAMDVYPSEEHLFEAEYTIHSVLRYMVECEGSLVLECSPSLAFAFTGRLMDIPTPVSVNEDVVDAIGELVNMIGGNLKGLLPADTEISSPFVSSREPLNHGVTYGNELSCVGFSCVFGWCRLILYAGKPAKEPSNAVAHR